MSVPSLYRWCRHPAQEYIFLRPDDNADLAGIAAGQTLQFNLPTARTDRRGCRLWRRRTADLARGTFDGHPC